jgi:hypothetical protein
MVAVNPAQTLQWAAPPPLALFGQAVVSATASSGLPVSYSSKTPALCTVHSASGLVTSLTAGDCTIAADQAGDSHFNPAPQVLQVLPVAAWSWPVTAPGAPTEVAATLGATADSTVVRFVGPASSGGSPVTGYTVVSIPAGFSATGAASPIVVACPSGCAGRGFAVVASNAIGNSAPSAAADVLTRFKVTATFFEPDTQPNDTIFTGSFVLNSTQLQVTGLSGQLTESMTGPPMVTVPLAYQLSSVGDGQGGLLVSSFALNTTNVFAGGGFPTGSEGLYYGWPTAPNPGAPGGVGNSSGRHAARVGVSCSTGSTQTPMEQAMSDSPNLGFGKFVPGFDFLQNLAKGATQNIPQMPNLGNWVAPTLNVEELDKRIEELKAVQFWLDQNAMALKATIQALEVQKMTLATLKGMNFNMGDVANAFKLKAADTVMSGVQKVTDTAAGAAGAVSGVAGAVTGVASGMASMASDVASAATAKRSAAKAEAKAAAAPAAGLVDPLQWWGALTQQFQQIAASAMKDAAKQTAMDTTKHMATGLAKDALKTAGAAVRAPARKAAAKKAARKTTASRARG